MVKLAGVALIVLSSSMTGAFLASGLSKRVTAIESTIGLYRYFRDRLCYLQPSVRSLVESAACRAEFAELGFLRQCRDDMRDGADFPESWRAAVNACTAQLGRESAEIAASLADTLGASDLESQLAAINYGASLLEARLESAREYAAKHRRLYRRLGVLAGLAIAVIFI